MSSPSTAPASSLQPFPVVLTFQGKSTNVTVVASTTTGADLHRQAVVALRDTVGSRPWDGSHSDSDTTELKLLYRGKQIPNDDSVVFGRLPEDAASKKPPKIMVVATKNSSIHDVRTKRSDPTIRGLDQEIAMERQREGTNGAPDRQRLQQHWAEGMVQNREYKFCRFQACTWQSFGHRPTDQTPHAFQAMQLLEKLATDPGIVAIMRERELVVGTLGEMDPIDDRLMLQKQQAGGGGCLLGYNTNAGTRIDIKLRTDDLKHFRPYHELAATLIHELSHNWVGEHNLLFWTNYAQMRAEYLYTHATLRSTIVRGKTTAELAGLDAARLENVFDCIMHELVREMGQHGLHPSMIQSPIHQRIQELEESHRQGQRLGGNDVYPPVSNGDRDDGRGARELALAAAERRAREQQKKDSNQR